MWTVYDTINMIVHYPDWCAYTLLNKQACDILGLVGLVVSTKNNNLSFLDSC